MSPCPEFVASVVLSRFYSTFVVRICMYSIIISLCLHVTTNFSILLEKTEDVILSYELFILAALRNHVHD